MKNTTYPFKLASLLSLSLATPLGPLPAYRSAVHVTSVLCDDLIPGVGWRQIQDGWNHDQSAEFYTTLTKFPAVWRKNIQTKGRVSVEIQTNLTSN